METFDRGETLFGWSNKLMWHIELHFPGSLMLSLFTYCKGALRNSRLNT